MVYVGKKVEGVMKSGLAAVDDALQDALHAAVGVHSGNHGQQSGKRQ